MALVWSARAKKQRRRARGAKSDPRSIRESCDHKQAVRAANSETRTWLHRKSVNPKSRPYTRSASFSRKPLPLWHSPRLGRRRTPMVRHSTRTRISTSPLYDGISQTRYGFSRSPRPARACAIENTLIEFRSVDFAGARLQFSPAFARA
jgi:hypothetical protein